MSGKYLNVKDLITIGLFTAIYFIVFYVVGMVGFIPVAMVILPFLIGFVGGIPILLMENKVQKFGMMSICGTIVCLLMFLTGHPWTILAFGIPLAILSDAIMSFGKYQSWSLIVLGYTVFSLWSVGALLPFYFMKEAYLKSIENGYGKGYAETLNQLFSYPMLIVIIVGSIIGSLLGCLLAKNVVRRHFVRAGIV